MVQTVMQTTIFLLLAVGVIWIVNFISDVMFTFDALDAIDAIDGRDIEE